MNIWAVLNINIHGTSRRIFTPCEERQHSLLHLLCTTMQPNYLINLRIVLYNNATELSA